MSEHSILPPSGAEVWRLCQMWITMNNLYPQQTTEDSKEGEAAHWVISSFYNYGLVARSGDEASNGVIVTDEMIQGAELFFQAASNKKATPTNSYCEKLIPIRRIHEQCFGTPDLWHYDDDTKFLRIFDYKFGHGFVDEFENYQCMAYAAGILEELGSPDFETTVEIIIVQPRCFYKGSAVRSWTIKASDMRPYIAKLNEVAKLALGPNPISVTNSGCKNCSGRHACAAYQKAAYYDAEIALQSTPVELPPEAASLELKMLERSLERLNGRVDGLREYVTGLAKQGKSIPHHQLEQTEGRLNWTVTPDEVITLGQLLDVDLAKKAVLTPQQALQKGLDKYIIDNNAKRDKGSIKLVPVDQSAVRKIFGA